MSYTKQSLALFFLALANWAGASPLFEDDSVLALELTGPLSSLIEEREDREEFPFVLRVDGVEHEVTLRVRGKSRARVCDFPPLRLTFTGQQPEETVFVGQRSVKLVTHCKSKDSAQMDVLEEYAAYRIFNLISDVGFRVRLVQITYHDTDGGMKEKEFVRTGFLIEPRSRLADRIDGERVKITGVSLKSLDTEQAATVYVFQYLIGNTDWSLVTADEDDTCCHNIALFDIGSQRFLVPYDFDLSGLVDAPYAKPDPSIGTRTVTQRRYRGYCISDESLVDAITAIAGRKSDILDVLPTVPGISEKSVRVGNKYLAKFFKQAENVDKLARSFERRCL